MCCIIEDILNCDKNSVVVYQTRTNALLLGLLFEKDLPVSANSVDAMEREKNYSKLSFILIVCLYKK